MQGGKRKNSGRKKLKDKKKTIGVCYRKSVIKAHGGEKKLKAKIYSLVPAE